MATKGPRKDETPDDNYPERDAEEARAIGQRELEKLQKGWGQIQLESLPMGGELIVASESSVLIITRDAGGFLADSTIPALRGRRIKSVKAFYKGKQFSAEWPDRIGFGMDLEIVPEDKGVQAKYMHRISSAGTVKPYKYEFWPDLDLDDFPQI